MWNIENVNQNQKDIYKNLWQNIFYEKQPNQESFNNSNTDIYHSFFNQSYGFHDANAGHNHSNSNQPF